MFQSEVQLFTKQRRKTNLETKGFSRMDEDYGRIVAHSAAEYET